MLYDMLKLSRPTWNFLQELAHIISHEAHTINIR